MATPNLNAYAKATLSPQAKFAAARLWACERCPYFRAAIMALIVKPTEGLGTMAVSEHGLLYVDFEALKSWAIEKWGTGIIHEVGHYLRDHAGRCRACAAQPEEWNLAADAELNDDFLAAPFKPGEDWIFPKTFGAPNGLTAEAYLSFVRKQQANKPKPQPSKSGSGEPEDGEGGSPGQGKGQPKPGQGGAGEGEGGEGIGKGWCGSAGGRKAPCETDADKGEGRSKAYGDQVRRQVAEAIQRSEEASQGRGTIPGGWKRWAGDILAPAKVDWREKLGRIVRGSVAFAAGCVDYSYARPSRRQAGLGFGARSPVLPCLRRPIPKVAVIVDTSGSMGTEELTTAARETNGVLKALGAEVTFCTNDATVHTLKKVRDISQAIEELMGGGGTDFRPPFEALAEMRDGKPDVVIFITDGMGPAPVEDPGFCHTIWVLVGKYRTMPSAGNSATKITWGESVEVED